MTKSKLTRYTVYRLTGADRLKYGVYGIGLAALVSKTMYNSLPMFLVMGLPAFLLMPVLMKPQLKQKRLEKISVHFREAIGILSGYISAGYSVENAFGTTAAELEKLYGNRAEITVEFSRIYSLARLNRPVGEALADFSERTGIQDIRNFSEVFIIAGKTGGNLREIIERTASVIREKMAVGEEIANMTAGKRFEQKIMNMVPFLIVLYLNFSSPGFLDVMYTTALGRIIMTACLGVAAGSYLLSQKILDIRI